VGYVDRNDSRKPPVSAHPLFPAVVALWFAALFGLGSLVLPTLLIERAIVLSGIDSVFPPAAPPLGVTARIAVSAAMALGGAVLGFIIARKLAQATSRPVRTGRRPYKADYFDEPRARRPISARDELGATRLETPRPPDPGMASRRRALAMEEDDRRSDFLHAAPLPGAAQNHAPPPAEPEPLDLARFEAPPPAQPQPEQGYGDQLAALRNSAPSGEGRPETIAPVADFARPPAPDFAQPDFRPPPPIAHHFNPPAASPVAQAAQDFSRPAPQAAAAPAPQFTPPAELPVADFSRPAAPPPLPFARPDAPVGSDPLAPFRAPDLADEPELEDEEEFYPFGAGALSPAPPPVPEPQPLARAIEPEPLPFAPPIQGAEPEEEPLAFFAPSQTVEEELPEEQPAAPEPEPVAAAQPREPLDGLSMVDLAERLAKSLGRQGSTIAPPAGLAAALGAQIAPRPAAPVEAEPLPEPEPMDEFAEETDELEELEEYDEEPAEFARTFGAPPPPVIPEALRPIPLELEEFGEDEDDLDLSLSFGRKILAEKTPPPGAQVFIADPLDEQDELEDGEMEDEDDDLSEIAGYSSLLGMKSPFRVAAEFIRIEQPEPADAPAEPAVVFPGQKASVPLPAPNPEPAPAEPQIRRFDAPGNAAPVEVPAAGRPRVDRDEAERSLRSALATLQRMSGAA
jgi:hypothetical protein